MAPFIKSTEQALNICFFSLSPAYSLHLRRRFKHRMIASQVWTEETDVDGDTLSARRLHPSSCGAVRVAARGWGSGLPSPRLWVMQIIDGVARM